jgi:hypothetical protein
MSAAILLRGKDGGNFSYPMFLARTEAKDLKTARVGDQWPLPTHKSMEPPHACYEIFARLEVEMVGIGNNHLVSDLTKIFLG